LSSACASAVAASRIHVVTLTPFYPHRGDDAAGCFIAEPLRYLGDQEVSSTVIAAQPFYRGSHDEGEGSPGAKYRSFFSLPRGFGLPSSGAFLFARVLQEIRREHRENRIDLIHAHGALPCGHAAALLRRKLGIPFVVSVHGLDAFSTTQVRGPVGAWCRRNSQMVYESAQRVICISERVRQQVIAGTKNAKTCVVHNGVDTNLFAPAIRRTSTPLILSVGNLIASKGHELLIRAVAGLSQTHSDLVCEIIGDGPELRRLKSVAARLGIANRVRFPGRRSRDEVAEAMRRCAIFALPSSYEGLGCVYLEAMASGKPVLGCREQGIEEIIDHGINGFLISPGNLDELISFMRPLLGDESLRARIGQAARKTIVDRLMSQHQAEQLNQVYRECLV